MRTSATGKNRRTIYGTATAGCTDSVTADLVALDAIQNPIPANNNPTAIDAPPAMRSR
jgi:hypothetical protein